MIPKLLNEIDGREFWLIDETPFSTWVSHKPLHSADVKEEIHVIDRATFDRVCAALVEAVNFRDGWADHIILNEKLGHRQHLLSELSEENETLAKILTGKTKEKK